MLNKSFKAGLVILLATGSTIALAEDALKTDKAILSYTLGVQIGQDFKQRGVDLDVDVLASAIKEMMANKEPRITREQMVQSLQKLQQEQMNQMKQVALKNQEKGVKFLAENKKKKGVTELASGVQYKVMTKGNGKKPTSSNSVVAHYRGTLIDGKEFDSSYKRGQPATFPVSGVIQGWQEILQLMPAGSKWEVYIPSSLAYGERGAGGDIGPNETLIFEIELIDVK